MATRVLVVDDSATVRNRLCEVLTDDPEIKVVGEASDGKAAIELCGKLRPDVITMDMVLPVISGVAATEYIMAHFPTPILIVSSSLNRGELFHTFDALAAGAVDILEKPAGDEAPGAWESALVSTVKLVSRIRVITHPRARLRPLTNTQPAAVLRATAEASRAPAPPVRSAKPFTAVAIGASTGGPGAIVEVLKSIPAAFPLPILLVLHIAEAFGSAFADWLDSQTHHRVAYARDGETIPPGGRVVMAPPGRHLVIEGGRVRLTLDAERYSCRPSVDVLFESVAREYGAGAAACLLTGMGRDGASGLLAIRNAGGLTVAQDEATSVVYGMPREAFLIGAAERVLPLPEIGPMLAALPV